MSSNIAASAATTGRGRTAPPRRRLAPGARRALLVVHIISSVALLGASASVLLLAVTGASTDDPELASAAYRFASTSGLVFGIPLSFTALLSGIALAVGGKWGLVRYPWVTTKLGLLVAAILSGALLIGPNADRLIHDPSGAAAPLILGAAFNVAALAVSTALSVYRPGKRSRRR
ncbi:MAG: hypothetical protein Q8O56_16040 [Solirubrobacteraceae bacterium]|nr:hypothetical protein [Solirubrobacteraceae bacterium]